MKESKEQYNQLVSAYNAALKSFNAQVKKDGRVVKNVAVGIAAVTAGALKGEAISFPKVLRLRQKALQLQQEAKVQIKVQEAQEQEEPMQIPAPQQALLLQKTYRPAIPGPKHIQKLLNQFAIKFVQDKDFLL